MARCGYQAPGPGADEVSTRLNSGSIHGWPDRVPVALAPVELWARADNDVVRATVGSSGAGAVAGADGVGASLESRHSVGHVRTFGISSQEESQERSCLGCRPIAADGPTRAMEAGTMQATRFGSPLLAIAVLGGCGGTVPSMAPPAMSPTSGVTATATATAPSAEPVLSLSPTPGPTPADDWPVVRTSCPDAAGDPWLLVAIGTSESDEPGEYPELYADILCSELDAPVELHGYYPTQGLAPLGWWIGKATGDEELRADLAAADEIVLWAMSSHDIVPALLLSPCAGSWPDPLRACIEAATADIVAETDELFGLVADLARDDAIVLAGGRRAAVVRRAVRARYLAHGRPVLRRRAHGGQVRVHARRHGARVQRA